MSALVVISGTSGGLGRALYEAIAPRGPTCITIARSPAPASRARHIVADLAEPRDWTAQLAPLLRQLAFARVWFFDIAAILPQAPVLGDDFAVSLEEAMQVNVLSPLAIARALADAARARDARLDIVHTSSGAAQRAIPGWGAYCATKAAARLMWEGLAAENPFIRAHVCQPGVIDTAMQARLRAAGDPAAAPADALRPATAVAAGILAEVGFAP